MQPHEDLQGLQLDQRLVTLLKPSTFEAEQYRRLRHRLSRLPSNPGCPVIAVTSAAAGEGKTLTAINLAAALAEAPDTRVLIVEADLRRPALRDHFNGVAGEDDGLERALNDPAVLVSSAKRLPTTRLAVLTAQPRRRGAYDLLSSMAFARLIDEARQQFDFVVIDAAPLLAVPDALALQRVVDGFIVVVAAQATPKRLLAEALDMLDEQSVLGLVFNGDDALSLDYSYYRSRVRDYAAVSAAVAR